jgi:CRP-like cAMP-binding protein
MGVFNPMSGNPGVPLQIAEHEPDRGGASRAAAGRKHPGKPATKTAAKSDGRVRGPRSASGSGDGASAAPEVERNRLLSALSPHAYADLQRQSEMCTLDHGHLAYEPGVPVTDLYFPQTAVFSMVREMTDGAGIEVGTIGREGVVGGGVLSGATSMSTRCIVQIPGRAWRIAAPALRDAVARSLLDGAEAADGGAILADLLQRYAQALFEQVTQTAACNRLHALEQRCARWLLMTHDRVDGDELALTQEFLSYMLGVRRAGVTEACGTLQRSGLIRYRHGHITVVDRAGLEAAACECYAVAAGAYTELLGALVDGTPPTASPRSASR